MTENDAAFSWTSTCGMVLASNASCAVAVTFSPTTTGTKTAVLGMQTNAASNPSVNLSGNGTAPVISVDPAKLEFSATIGTTSVPQTFTISNTGTAGLVIDSVTLNGSDPALFLETNSCPAIVAPAGSCAVSIAFWPTSVGSKAASVIVKSSAASDAVIALSGVSAPLPPPPPTPPPPAPAPPPVTPPQNYPPYAAADASVLLDIGVTSLNPRNTWQNLPSGFTLGQITGAVAGTVSDTGGFTPNSGGYIQNFAAFPNAPSSQGTIYMRLQRSALAADNSADAGAMFYDSAGNTTGGYGTNAAVAFTVFDGVNNLIEWAMSAQPFSSLQILNSGSWLYPATRSLNSHAAIYLDPSYVDVFLTWQDTKYWAYCDGIPVAYGNFASALPSTGQFSQIVIGGYLGGSGSNGHPLGPFSIQRFQISTAFSPPPLLSGEPRIGFYGDSFVVQGGGVTENIAGLSGSPTLSQVNAVQAQLDQTTSPNATGGFNGQDGFVSRAQAYALSQFGGYLQFYTAAQSGHGWAYTGMGATNAVDTPAIDDFALGKTGFSDALNAAQPDYIFAFGSVNDVNNGVPGDIAGDTQAHFDYWANHNPNLRGIYFVETLSLELTAAATSRGGPVGWKAEMARQRGLLRAAFGSGYLAGTRKVPVTYIPTYETWVQGANSARFLVASNPDNHSQSSNAGTSPNGHPDAEGNIQIIDTYLWPYLQKLLH